MGFLAFGLDIAQTSVPLRVSGPEYSNRAVYKPGPNVGTISRNGVFGDIMLCWYFFRPYITLLTKGPNPDPEP